MNRGCGATTAPRQLRRLLGRTTWLCANTIPKERVHNRHSQEPASPSFRLAAATMSRSKCGTVVQTQNLRTEQSREKLGSFCRSIGQPPLGVLNLSEPFSTTRFSPRQLNGKLFAGLRNSLVTSTTVDLSMAIHFLRNDCSYKTAFSSSVPELEDTLSMKRILNIVPMGNDHTAATRSAKQPVLVLFPENSADSIV